MMSLNSLTASPEGAVSCDCLGRGTPGSLLLIWDERGWAREGFIYPCCPFSTCLPLQWCGMAGAIPQELLGTRNLGDTLPAARRLCRVLRASLCSHPRAGGSCTSAKCSLTAGRRFPVTLFAVPQREMPTCQKETLQVGKGNQELSAWIH